MTDRKFMFTYRYAGDEYGLDVSAGTEQEARERVKQMSMARYDGEVFATIPVPGGGLILRFLNWLKMRPDR